MKITEYADVLLSDLDKLSGWPESVKLMQKNWIGKSKGLNINFKSCDHDYLYTAFTTRPDTIFGVSFIAVSINHPLAKSLSESNNYIKEFIKKYQSSKVSEEEMAKIDKD